MNIEAGAVLCKGPPLLSPCRRFRASILTLSDMSLPIIPGSAFELYLHGQEVREPTESAVDPNCDSNLCQYSLSVGSFCCIPSLLLPPRRHKWPPCPRKSALRPPRAAVVGNIGSVLSRSTSGRNASLVTAPPWSTSRHVGTSFWNRFGVVGLLEGSH